MMPTLHRHGWYLLAFLVAVVMSAPLPAAADGSVLHARLEASVPAAGDTLDAPLDTVRLQFSAAVTASLTRLLVTGPQGDTVVLAAAADAGDRRVIVAPLPALGAGAHVLHWRTTSSDGHVLEGTIPFVVGPGAAVVAPASGPAPADAAAVSAAPIDSRTAAALDVAVPVPAPGTAAETPPLLPLLRALGTALLLALAGGLLFATRDAVASDALRPVLRVIAIAAPLVVVAEFVVWTTHVAGAFDAGASLQLMTGQALFARIGFAVLAAATLFAFRSLRGAAFLAFMAVLAGGSLGHATAVVPAVSIPLRAVHMAAAAVWLGGLIALGLALHNAPARHSLLRAVSSAALVSFVVVAVTGAGQALLLLGSLGAFVQTSYGRLVLVKATGLLLLAAFGYLHRRMIALVPEGGDARALGRSVVVETLVFIALILVSGALAFAQLPE